MATPLALPPNISPDVFDRFVREIKETVGSENIKLITSVAQLNDGSYLEQPLTHDSHHILDQDYLVASAVVSPRSVPEIQAIVRAANSFQIPLWPISIGRNLGYGGAAPRLRGSVVLELGKHNKRVLEVNVDGAYAVVEPGVTFADLYQHLVDNKLDDKLWIDVCFFHSIWKTVGLTLI